jgi:flagella basal body P-ring formation protein FlgA
MITHNRVAAAFWFIFILFSASILPQIAHADSGVFPVPVLTIYPGDVIKDEWLENHAPPAGTTGLQTGAFIDSRQAIVGKIARQTLLPGRPIPVNAVGERKLVTNGAMVKVVFQEGGLTITTYGAAMRAGTAGDIVTVRNLDSGLIISGIVQSDGSVFVGDS